MNEWIVQEYKGTSGLYKGKLIRCMDCKYSTKTADKKYCMKTFGISGIVEDMDYCSKGKRRNENE